MYGYPTQTVQETVDSLEMVRQLFELGIIQSGFWHQFALTAHSPVGLHPEDYGVIPDLKPISFANNDIDFKDKIGVNHSKFSYGLKKSLFNFMHGIGFDMSLQEWFDFKIPTSTISSDYIYNCLEKELLLTTKPTAKVAWIGPVPLTNERVKKKKGMTWQQLELSFHTKTDLYEIIVDKDKGQWLLSSLEKLKPVNKPLSYGQLKKDYESQLEDFELFWYSKQVTGLREHGLLVL
jgi:hypothetical protein